MTTPNAARTITCSPPVQKTVEDTVVKSLEISAASRGPRLHSAARSGRDDGNQKTPSRPPISQYHLNILATLRGQLDSLNGSEALVPHDVVHFFACLKAAEKSKALPTIIRDHSRAPELARLRRAMALFLRRFNEDINPQEKSGAVDCTTWSVEQLRTVFLGLAACANPYGGRLFSNDQLEGVCPSLQGITDVLMRLVVAKNLPGTAQSAGVVLDTMNWLSRGLKSALIMPSEDIHAFVPQCLKALLAWSTPAAGNSPAASKSDVSPDATPPSVTSVAKGPHQIGKCAVQVYPIYRFQLLGTDRVAYENLKRLALNLCSDAFLDRLEATPVEVVAVINMTNMVKDCLEEGLLSAADPQLAKIVPRLLELVAMIPPAELARDGGRTAGNCGNFLRTLIEMKLAGHAELVAVPETRFGRACRILIDIGKAPVIYDGQTTVNLLSLMKALDKCFGPPRRKAIEQGSVQHEVLIAASNLIDNAVTQGAQGFARPEALGGLLAGLGYFAGRKLHLSEGVHILLHALMRSMARISHEPWSKQSRGNALRGMEIMLDEKMLGIGDMQESLPVLLGEPSRSDGVTTEADLRRGVIRWCTIRNVVEPLPPLEWPPQSPQQSLPQSPPVGVAPAASDALSAATVSQPDTVPPPPRPGYTAIVPDMPPPTATTTKPKKKERLKECAAPGTITKLDEVSTTARPVTHDASAAGSTTSTSLRRRGKAPNGLVRAAATGKTITEPTSPVSGQSSAASSVAKIDTTVPSLVSRSSDQKLQAQSSRSHDTRDAGASPVKQRARNNAILPPAKTAAATATVAATVTAPGGGKESAAVAHGAILPVTSPDTRRSTAGPREKAVPIQKKKAARTTPQQKWFDLLKNEQDPLPRLEELARASPQLFNAKDAQDKSGRAAIFYAITKGHPDVVAWLMDQKSHKIVDAPGAFLNSILDAVVFEEPDMIVALETFLELALKGQCVRSAADLKNFSRAKALPLHEVSQLLRMHKLLESDPNTVPSTNRRGTLHTSESFEEIESTSRESAGPASIRNPVIPGNQAASSTKRQVHAVPALEQKLLLLPGDPDQLRIYLERLGDTDEAMLLAHAQALIMALDEKNPALARVLIEHRGGELVEKCLRNKLLNPLTAAAVNGDLENMRRLIRHGDGKLLQPEYSAGISPLTAAIYHHRHECAELLANSMNDAQLRSAAGSGLSPLTVAVSYGAGELVRILVARLPELAFYTDLNGKTALQHALDTRQPEIVQMLQAVVQPVRKSDRSGPPAAKWERPALSSMRPISRPLELNAIDPDEPIFARDAQFDELDESMQTSVGLVSKTAPPGSVPVGDVSALKKFLLANPTPDEAVLTQCLQALEISLVVQHHEMCAALIAYQDGAILELSSRHYNPLINAANLHPETFRLLLDYRGGSLLDADADGNTPLQSSIRNTKWPIYNNVTCACLLIAEMDDTRLAWTNPRGENALTLATLEGNEKIASLLFGRLPALAQQPDIDGWTPLDHAIRGMHAALVRLFTSQ